MEQKLSPLLSVDNQSEIWERDPRNPWKNHIIINVDGEAYRMEKAEATYPDIEDVQEPYSRKKTAYTVLVHVYNTFYDQPYHETVIASIEFSSLKIDYIERLQIQDSESKELICVLKDNVKASFSEILLKNDEMFKTDILFSTSDGPRFLYEKYLRIILSSRRERLEREKAENDRDPDIKLPYE